LPLGLTAAGPTGSRAHIRLFRALTPTRCPRSDGHSAGRAGRHQGPGLAKPDPAQAVSAELGRVRVGAEVGQVEHLGLGAA